MRHWRSGLFCLLLLCALALFVGADDEGEFTPVATSQEPNKPEGPMPDSSTHRLAPGDYLLVTFWDGRMQEEYKVQVDAAGAVTLPLLGQVQVGDLIPRAAADLLRNSYSLYYRRPQVSLQVLDYGQFEVFVFGADYPGRIYKLDSGSRLLDLLEAIRQNEEIAEHGKYRRLHLLRGGFDLAQLAAPQAAELQGSNILAAPSPTAVIRSEGTLAGYTNWRPWIEARLKDPACTVQVIDPLNLTVEGEMSRYNVVLQDGDALFIPTPEKFVDIKGVTNSGRYELLGGETLGDILRFCGTINYSADLANAVIRRFDECGQLTRLIVNLYPMLDDLSCIEDFELRNRDEISIVPRELRVFVLGEVKMGGAFPFAEDATVLDYLAQAGGETAEAHLAWIAIIRQPRDRMDPQQPAEVIQVNFKEIHAGLPLAGNYFPIPGDVIYVPPKGFTFNLTELLQASSTLITGFAVAENLSSSNSNTDGGGGN